ncbi:MAG: phosphate ABC transporter permease PstA, partial [Pseudomonadota bacterium]
MTDVAQTATPASGVHTTSEARRRLARRYGAERRFKAYGIVAVLIATGFLLLMLGTILRTGIPAFSAHYATLPVMLDTAEIDPDGTNDPAVIGRYNFDTVIRDSLRAEFPGVESRADRRLLNGIVTGAAGIRLRNDVVDDLSLIGQTFDRRILMSDTADNYLKGMVTRERVIETTGIATPTGTSGEIEIFADSNAFDDVLVTIKDALRDQAVLRRNEADGRQLSLDRLQDDLRVARERLATATDENRQLIEEQIVDIEENVEVVTSQRESFIRTAELLEERADALNEQEPADTNVPSFLVRINGGFVRVTSADNATIAGTVMLPLESAEPAQSGAWDILVLERPESNRQISDQEIVWLKALEDQGLVSRTISEPFFTAGASREAELAGIWGAVVGSFWTMIVTLILSFPIGVAAAIYLEEFAPKNALTQFIEVNINNLAAVPSIVYGLLGLSVFLNVFGLPRSAPVVGGMVIALMTLPTIIIASRAAIRAVPPSIREAALGMGASRMQATFHHVLPLAMPGILTGTIIGMAAALGETAPLLMIGMVAFIVDIPSGPLSAATVIPVQIYMWADFPEQAFTAKTSAAILVLLGFLITMNAMAIILRKR